LIGHGGMESFTMPEAGVDSLLVYGFTAMIAHFLMSLGQTLFHRYLGHTRFGGRFFKNHIQFHHTHYSGDHVVSTHYLDNGDNNTLFFLMPVAVIVILSHLFLRLDFLVVQLAAMSLSFCGITISTINIMLRDRGLGAFRGSGESSNSISSTIATGTATSR
jgi:hypothetical protein